MGSIVRRIRRERRGRSSGRGRGENGLAREETVWVLWRFDIANILRRVLLLVVIFGALRVVVERWKSAVVSYIFAGDVFLHFVLIVRRASVDFEDWTQNDVYFSDDIGDDGCVCGVILFDPDVDYSFIYWVCWVVWHSVWSRVWVIAANVFVCSVWTRVRDWIGHLGESIWRVRIRAVDREEIGFLWSRRCVEKLIVRDCCFWHRGFVVFSQSVH